MDVASNSIYIIKHVLLNYCHRLVQINPVILLVKNNYRMLKFGHVEDYIMMLHLLRNEKTLSDSF